MLIIDRSVITDGGAALLNSGDPINITSVKTGSGTYTSSEDIKSRTALKSTQYSYTPSSVTVDGATRSIDALLSNYDPVTEQAIVTSDYTLTEVGLFATVNGADVLFAIAVSYNGTAVPAYTGQNKSEIIVSWDMALSGTDAITITATGAPALATDLNAHVGTLVLTNSGVHGIRAVKNGDDITLQVNDGGTWKDVAGGGTDIVPIPVQDTSATYTYDGTEQSIAWTTAPDTSKVLVIGDSYINAGTYTCTCALKKAGDVWSDSTTANKTFTWTIDKATPTLTISPPTMTFDKTHTASQSLTITSTSDGAISLSGYDSDLIAVAGASSPYTVSCEQVNGTTSITISQASTANYASATDSVGVICNFVYIYGAQWDATAATTWTRTDDATSFTDPVPYISGATSYGSPFDDIQPWAGMTKSTRNGNVVVAIPKFWYKLTQEGGGIKIQISNGEVDGFSVSPAHMDRGDGAGERDVVYVGRYHCDSTYKSVTGATPISNVLFSDARTAIHATGANIYPMDYTVKFSILLLYLVEYANWDMRAVIGYGGGNGTTSSNMGYTDSMPYHTGTTQSSRTTYGLGTQYRNIEGLWDNVRDSFDGMYNSGTGIRIVIDPSDFGDNTKGVSVGTGAHGYPKTLSVVTSGPYPMWIPATTSTTALNNSYTCSYWSTTTSRPFYNTGAYYVHDYAGWCNFSTNDAADAASTKSIASGFRIMELP